MHLILHSVLAAFVAIQFLLATAANNDIKGVKCSDHPLFRPDFRGELIRSWTYTRKDDRFLSFSDSGYIPRYQQHAWAPIDDLESEKYRNLDYFATYLARNWPFPTNYVTLSFQRKAKVYLLASGYDERFPEVRLSGWKPEGWVKMVKGSGRNKAALGVFKKMHFHVPVHAYVFSKPASEDVVLPSVDWVSHNLRGLSTNGYYNILVAEADGSPVQQPSLPSGANYISGGRCPDELHEAWVAKGGDSADASTKNFDFRTYHPIWDPCYWCAYDHEHGSNPKHLMGYEPKYGYVALKNGNEEEAHNGFKNMVLDAGKHLIYYGIHAHLSHPRRFFTRFHTVVIAVADARTKELLVELSYKADFGFLAVREADRKTYPVNEADRRLFERQHEGLETKGMRNINIINPDNLNRRYLYRHTGKEILKGQYEQWEAAPMCVDQRLIRGPLVDIKSPQTGLRTARSSSSGMIRLGRWLHGKWHPHVGVNRDFRVKNMELSFDYCGFGEASEDGVFYTDPYGKDLMPGPGKRAVRQFIKPGTRIFVEGGVFMPDDTWHGLQKVGKIGGMRDITYAVNPYMN